MKYWDQELFEALHRYNINAFKIAINNGANINAKNESGYSPIHITTFYRNIDTTRRLLQLGANPNAQDLFGNTPLHHLAPHKEYELAELLLEKGADPDLINSDNCRNTFRNLVEDFKNVKMLAILSNHDLKKSENSVSSNPLLALASLPKRTESNSSDLAKRKNSASQENSGSNKKQKGIGPS